jgi:hypothetical protein
MDRSVLFPPCQAAGFGVLGFLDHMGTLCGKPQLAATTILDISMLLISAYVMPSQGSGKNRFGRRIHGESLSTPCVSDQVIV